MYPSPPDMTSIGGTVRGLGDSGVLAGDPGDSGAPGTATKKVTASRWPWKLSCACAIEHQGIVPVGLADLARAAVACPERIVNSLFMVSLANFLSVESLLYPY